MGLLKFFQRHKKFDVSDQSNMSEVTVLQKEVKGNGETNISINTTMEKSSSVKDINDAEPSEVGQNTQASQSNLLEVVDSDCKSDLPTKIEDFKDCHFRCLNRLQRCPVGHKFNGSWASEIDIPLFIPILMDLNLLEYADYQFSVNLLSIEQLKSILQIHAKKITGKKHELIKRVIAEIPKEDILKSDAYVDHYIITLTGLRVLEENKTSTKHQKQQNSFFNALNRKELIESLMTLYSSNCRLHLTTTEYNFIDALLQALEIVHMDLPLNYEIRGGMLNFLVGKIQIGRVELYQYPYRIQILTKSDVIWINLNSPDEAVRYIPQWIDYCKNLQKYF